MSSALFKECIEALDTQVLPLDESQKVSNLFCQLFPLTDWGKIDWGKIEQKMTVEKPYQIIPALEKLIPGTIDKSVYIEWSDNDIPAIAADLDTVIDNFCDVSCVASEKFIFNPLAGYIIEERSFDTITVGVLPPATWQQ